MAQVVAMPIECKIEIGLIYTLLNLAKRVKLLYCGQFGLHLTWAFAVLSLR